MNLQKHQRRVRDYLREIGATNVHLASGGKHPRMTFTYGATKHSYPIASTPTNSDHAAANSIADLRRLLKPNMLSQPRTEPRTLEEMTQMLNAKTVNDHKSQEYAFNTPRVLPAQPQKLKQVSCEGTVALYKGKDQKLTFRITGEMYEAFRALSPMQSRVQCEFLTPDTWKLTYNPTAGSRFVKSGTRYQMQPRDTATVKKLGYFYTTQAEYCLVDNSMVVTLKGEPKRYSDHWARQEARDPKKKPVVKQEPATETKALVDVANTTSNQATQLAALLEAIRVAEKTTCYRLVKSKETGDWMFIAPPIK